MRAYVQKIDISNDGKVSVTGYLSRTNLSVKLIEKHYVTPPADGIWEYDLEVLPTCHVGGEMIVPFSVEAPWIGDENANGVRIKQPSLMIGEPDREFVLLKGKIVKNFTKEQNNHINIQGGYYDKENEQLVVDVQYSGGCFAHNFALEWDGKTYKSYPPQYIFNLVDLSDYDPCKGIINTQLRFDINTNDFQLEFPSYINLGTINSDTVVKIELEYSVEPVN